MRTMRGVRISGSGFERPCSPLALSACIGLSPPHRPVSASAPEANGPTPAVAKAPKAPCYGAQEARSDDRFLRQSLVVHSTCFCGFRAILPRPVRGAAPKSTPVGHCEAATKKWSGRMTPYGPGGGGSSAALQFGVDPIGSNFSLRLASEPPALRLNRQKQVEWTTSPTIANLPNGVTFAIH